LGTFVAHQVKVKLIDGSQSLTYQSSEKVSLYNREWEGERGTGEREGERREVREKEWEKVGRRESGVGEREGERERGERGEREWKRERERERREMYHSLFHSRTRWKVKFHIRACLGHFYMWI
jgi:hypothetical protein